MLYARTHAKQRAHGCSYHPQPDQTRPDHQTVAACKVSPSETDIIITIMIMITIIDIDIDIDRRQIGNVPQDAGLCCIMGCRCRCRCRWERYISRHVPGDVRLGFDFGFGFGFALIFTYSHIHIDTTLVRWSDSPKPSDMISCLYDECLWSVCHLISKEHFPIMGWWAVLLFHDPKERCRIYFSDGASQDSCKSKSNPKDDGWMGGWIDGWIDGRMNDLVNISLYIPIPINTSTTQNQNQARYTGHRRETFLSAHNSILSQMWLVDRHFPLGRNWHVLQIESRKKALFAPSFFLVLSLYRWLT